MREWLADVDGATWLASISLLVSVLVAWRQHRSGGRAHFTADWSALGLISMTNHGPGGARNVEVSASSLRLIEDASRFAYIGALQRSEIYATQMLHTPVGDLIVAWKDNRFRRQRLVITLPMPPERTSHGPAKDVDSAVRQIAEAVTREHQAQRDRDFRLRRNS